MRVSITKRGLLRVGLAEGSPTLGFLPGLGQPQAPTCSSCCVPEGRAQVWAPKAQSCWLVLRCSRAYLAARRLLCSPRNGRKLPRKVLLPWPRCSTRCSWWQWCGTVTRGLPHSPPIRAGVRERLGGGRTKSIFVLEAIFWEQFSSVS